MNEVAALAGRLDSLITSSGARACPDQLDRLCRYLLLLARWNRAINLTGFDLEGFSEAALNRLIVEPLLALAVVPPGRREWLDVGSGGGSPAIPMKIGRPELLLTMVESRARKAAFLREAVREMDLAASVVAKPVEALPALGCRGRFEMVTIRGVRVDRALARVVHELLQPQGRLVGFGVSESPERDLFVRLNQGPRGVAIFERVS